MSLVNPHSHVLTSIVIAHPDTTIDPVKLKKWRKKLQDYYGWTAADLK
jgi:hypothetical protein